MSAILKLVQGTPEWLEHRRKYRNASETPAVLGVSPWVTPYQLWLERTGRAQTKVNAAMTRGAELEPAALAAIEPHLPEGSQSLGTRLDVRHIAATPVGMRVSALAEVVGVDGRTIRFRVEARDERELIGDGTHERVVVNVPKFD